MHDRVRRSGDRFYVGSNRSYVGKLVCALHRGLHFGLVHTNQGHVLGTLTAEPEVLQPLATCLRWRDRVQRQNAGYRPERHAKSSARTGHFTGVSSNILLCLRCRAFLRNDPPRDNRAAQARRSGPAGCLQTSGRRATERLSSKLRGGGLASVSSERRRRLAQKIN
jgi:hypothetical protein